MTTPATTDLAVQQAAGLRALADLIEANPDLAEPIKYNLRSLGAHIDEDENAPAVFAAFARAAKACGATVTKEYDGEFASVTATLSPAMKFYVQADRELVCERVVTGTETVTRKVPDPVALAEVPEIEVTEKREIVEWRCGPLLAASVDGAS